MADGTDVEPTNVMNQKSTDRGDGDKTEDYVKLVTYGLHKKLASILDQAYQSGKLSRDDLDERALSALKDFPIDGAVAVLNELLDANLEYISNKSAYLCGSIKTYKRRSLARLQGLEVTAPTNSNRFDSNKLKQILERTGYSFDITVGQRRYGGPPPNWNGSPPGNGCEIYCGNIPKNMLEDELIPLFENCGIIYDFRLIMDPVTGGNRGFAFATFTTHEEALNAVQRLHNYEIKPGKFCKSNLSVPNVRLFVGNIPKNKSKDEIFVEFDKITANLVNVIIYTSPNDKKKNRGFCFLEYSSHRDAVAAKRQLEVAHLKFWGCDILVDWADPQDQPDENIMSQVKILYVSNITLDVSEETIKERFEQYGEVERVKKIKDYAFVHFQERDDAVAAMRELNGKELGSSKIEVALAKPPSARKRKEEILRAREYRLMQNIQSHCCLLGKLASTHPNVLSLTGQTHLPGGPRAPPVPMEAYGSYYEYDFSAYASHTPPNVQYSTAQTYLSGGPRSPPVREPMEAQVGNYEYEFSAYASHTPPNILSSTAQMQQAGSPRLPPVREPMEAQGGIYEYNFADYASHTPPNILSSTAQTYLPGGPRSPPVREPMETQGASYEYDFSHYALDNRIGYEEVLYCTEPMPARDGCPETAANWCPAVGVLGNSNIPWTSEAAQAASSQTLNQLETIAAGSPRSPPEREPLEAQVGNYECDFANYASHTPPNILSSTAQTYLPGGPRSPLVRESLEAQGGNNEYDFSHYASDNRGGYEEVSRNCSEPMPARGGCPETAANWCPAVGVFGNSNIPWTSEAAQAASSQTLNQLETIAAGSPRSPPEREPLEAQVGNYECDFANYASHTPPNILSSTAQTYLPGGPRSPLVRESLEAQGGNNEYDFSHYASDNRGGYEEVSRNCSEPMPARGGCPETAANWCPAVGVLGNSNIPGTSQAAQAASSQTLNQLETIAAGSPRSPPEREPLEAQVGNYECDFANYASHTPPNILSSTAQTYLPGGPRSPPVRESLEAQGGNNEYDFTHYASDNRGGYEEVSRNCSEPMPARDGCPETAANWCPSVGVLGNSNIPGTSQAAQAASSQTLNQLETIGAGSMRSPPERAPLEAQVGDYECQFGDYASHTPPNILSSTAQTYLPGGPRSPPVRESLEAQGVNNEYDFTHYASDNRGGYEEVSRNCSEPMPARDGCPETAANWCPSVGVLGNSNIPGTSQAAQAASSQTLNQLETIGAGSMRSPPERAPLEAQVGDYECQFGDYASHTPPNILSSTAQTYLPGGPRSPPVREPLEAQGGNNEYDFSHYASDNRGGYEEVSRNCSEPMPARDGCPETAANWCPAVGVFGNSNIPWTSEAAQAASSQTLNQLETIAAGSPRPPPEREPLEAQVGNYECDFANYASHTPPNILSSTAQTYLPGGPRSPLVRESLEAQGGNNEYDFSHYASDNRGGYEEVSRNCSEPMPARDGCPETAANWCPAVGVFGNSNIPWTSEAAQAASSQTLNQLETIAAGSPRPPPEREPLEAQVGNYECDFANYASHTPPNILSSTAQTYLPGGPRSPPVRESLEAQGGNNEYDCSRYASDNRVGYEEVSRNCTESMPARDGCPETAANWCPAVGVLGNSNIPGTSQAAQAASSQTLNQLETIGAGSMRSPPERAPLEAQVGDYECQFADYASHTPPNILSSTAQTYLPGGPRSPQVRESLEAQGGNNEYGFPDYASDNRVGYEEVSRNCTEPMPARDGCHETAANRCPAVGVLGNSNIPGTSQAAQAASSRTLNQLETIAEEEE